MPRVLELSAAVLALLLLGSGASGLGVEGPNLSLSAQVDGQPFDPGERVALEPGDTVRLAYTVTNEGDARSGDYWLTLRGREDEQWPVQQRRDATLDWTTVDDRPGWRCGDPGCRLAPGESATVSMTLRVPEDAVGDYGVGATLDSSAGGGGTVMVPMPVSDAASEVETATEPPANEATPASRGDSGQDPLRVVAIVVTVISILVGILQLLS